MPIFLPVKLVLLAAGSLAIYAAYKDWKWFYKLPGISTVMEELGKEAGRVTTFVVGLILTVLAILWIF